MFVTIRLVRTSLPYRLVVVLSPPFKCHGSPLGKALNPFWHEDLADLRGRAAERCASTPPKLPPTELIPETPELGACLDPSELVVQP